MAAAKNLSLEWVDGMGRVDGPEWDALAWPGDTPFLSHDWLRLLEDSGSVGPGTGWTPTHLLARLDGRLVGAAPLYRKDHSEGEFVFDHALANLAGQAGIAYYPKLVGMSPFSPAGRYRFGVAPGECDDRNGPSLSRTMLDQTLAEAEAQGMGAVQYNYVDPDWVAGGEDSWPRRRGFMVWRHQSYAWDNPGYADFDEFLAVLRHGPRRNIRRERAAVRQAGVEVRMVEGADAPDAWFGLMHEFYAATNARFGPWHCKYLTPEFFRGLAGPLRRDLVFAAALRPGRAEPVAMSLFARRGDALYGRYWGFGEHVPLLHFECCYYRPIQWAIAHGIRRFDPGIGSEHKARRGFRAVPNLSVHHVTHEGLRTLLALHEHEINAAETAWLDELNALNPYKCSPNGP